MKSEFCGLLKSGRNIYPRCFGGQEIAIQMSKDFSGHPEAKYSHEHLEENSCEYNI